jgi:hypothetical protein
MVDVPQHVFMWVLRILNFHKLINSNTFGENERVLLWGWGEGGLDERGDVF